MNDENSKLYWICGTILKTLPFQTSSRIGLATPANVSSMMKTYGENLLISFIWFLIFEWLEEVTAESLFYKNLQSSNY